MYSVEIIYGIPEPREWRARRSVEKPYTVMVCPQGHYSREGFPSPGWKVCPECGEQPVKEERFKRVEVSPLEAYASGRLETDRDWDAAYEWVHIISMPTGEPVYLGTTLYSRDGNDTGGAPVPAPTAEQKVALRQYLIQLGYTGEDPGLHVVVRYS